MEGRDCTLAPVDPQHPAEWPAWGYFIGRRRRKNRLVEQL